MRITYFHRNIKAGFSINKVTQTVVSKIQDKEEFFVPESRASLISVLKNLLFVFRHRSKKGINHVTGDIHYCILALWGCKSVLTIHDTVSLDFAKTSRIKRAIIRFLWFYLPLKMATKVVCISETTRCAVKQIVNRDDILVIYNAVDPKIVPHKMRVDIDNANILIIGTNKNKNLLRMMTAMVGCNLNITIVGHIDETLEKYIKELKIHYTNVYDLTDSEIVDLYINCDIVLFCSLYEGFGMPIIEANAVGRPVITSNIPVLNEIGSNAVYYVDPYDIKSIRSGIGKVVSDRSLRDELIANGFINIKRFDQRHIVKQWNDLYESILN